MEFKGTYESSPSSLSGASLLKIVISDPTTGAIEPIESEPASLDPFPLLSSDDFFGCRDRVSHIAVDIPGQRLLAASWDHVVHVWSLVPEAESTVRDAMLLNPHKLHSRYKKLAELAHTDWVNCVEVVVPPADSAQARATLAVTGCEDGSLTVWNLSSYATEHHMHVSFSAVTAMDVYQDLCVALCMKEVVVVSVWTRSVLRRFTLVAPSRVNAPPPASSSGDVEDCVVVGTCCAVQKDGQLIFVGQSDGVVSCWDITGGFVVRELSFPLHHQLDSSQATSFTPSMPLGAATKSAAHRLLRSSASIRAIVLDPSHSSGTNVIASTDSGRIVMWSAASGEVVWSSMASTSCKPVLGLSVILKKKKTKPQRAGAALTPAAAASPPSPRFHEASTVYVVSCGLDGTVQYHDVEHSASVTAHGAYGLCMCSVQDPTTLEWRVVVGEGSGRVRSFCSTAALQALEEATR